jgi:hypothetical protein
MRACAHSVYVCVCLYVCERVSAHFADERVRAQVMCVFVCVRVPAQPPQGALAAMYGTNKMLPAEEMASMLTRYVDLLYKVKPAEAQ